MLSIKGAQLYLNGHLPGEKSLHSNSQLFTTNAAAVTVQN